MEKRDQFFFFPLAAALLCSTRADAFAFGFVSVPAFGLAFAFVAGSLAAAFAFAFGAAPVSISSAGVSAFLFCGLVRIEFSVSFRVSFPFSSSGSSGLCSGSLRATFAGSPAVAAARCPLRRWVCLCFSLPLQKRATQNLSLWLRRLGS